jgi:hypothetical protein
MVTTGVVFKAELTVTGTTAGGNPEREMITLVWPSATAVSRPLPSITATAGSAVAKATVVATRLLVAPLLKTPRAVTCRGSPA